MKLIKNVRIIDPSSKTDDYGDILCDEKKIIDIKPEIDAGVRDSMEVIDARGLIAAPGLVDIHVHFRDPGFTYKEDIYTGAKAAKAGGYTTVVMMANTKPVIDNEETLSYVLNKGRETDINVLACCGITKGLKGKELTDMEGLLKAGAVGFTDDGIPLTDENIVRAAMKEAARLDCVLSFHEEDPAYIKNNGINKGMASRYFGIEGSPRIAEISMIERDIELSLETGARVHFQHISAMESVDLIRKGKKRGARITAEATPHHFSLTEEACIRYKGLGKMNPPLRTEEDRLAIIEGLKDGTIDVIATDHAPHSMEEKSKRITECPSGITGLQSALGLGLYYLVKPGHISLMRLMELMSTSPARLYGLNAGSLKIGGPADICLFDMERPYLLKREDILSKSANTPFVL